MRLTRWLIARRDSAADAWLATIDAPRIRDRMRARRRLALWDALLGAWTSNGTRRV